MRIPHKCPVCNGHGTVSKPPSVAGDQDTWMSSGTHLYPCPACNGTCIIWEETQYCDHEGSYMSSGGWHCPKCGERTPVIQILT